MFYKTVVRPYLFRRSAHDAEIAHEQAIAFLSALGKSPAYRLIRAMKRMNGVDREVFGIRFPNPVGFAAGLDKHGLALRGLEAIGFGFGEVGTITPLPQRGNDRPRIFRLPEDRCAINRLGFNSVGASEVAHNMTMRGMPSIPIGVNVGMNKNTSLDNAAHDYIAGLRWMYPFASYFTFNTSSPNTPGLRKLQDRGRLDELLQYGQQTLQVLAAEYGHKKKPLVVKVAPDLTHEAMIDVLDVLLARQVAGIIVGNTTIERPGVLRSSAKTEVGGLSGPPLYEKTRMWTRFIKRHAPTLPIIAVGGIDTPWKALDLIEVCGASLVQIYTGLIYEGPSLPSRMARALWKVGPDPLPKPVVA